MYTKLGQTMTRQPNFWDTGDKKVVIFTSGKNPLFKKVRLKTFNTIKILDIFFPGR